MLIVLMVHLISFLLVFLLLIIESKGHPFLLIREKAKQEGLLYNNVLATLVFLPEFVLALFLLSLVLNIIGLLISFFF